MKQEPSYPNEQEPPAKLPRYSSGPTIVAAKEIRLRVSSLKLITSSRYFQVMLEGDTFPEGRELREHGLVLVELLRPRGRPDSHDDFLDIRHGNDVKLLTGLNLPGLEKVAVLVDKYQWHTHASRSTCYGMF